MTLDGDKTRLERAEEMDRWNSNTLHDHLTAMLLELEKRMDQRFTAQETATNAALVAAEKAVLKAEALASDRASQQNEWRGTVNDLIQTMMPRSEYEQAHGSMETQLASITSRMDQTQGQQKGASATVAYVFAAAAGVVAIGSLVLTFMSR